MRLLLLAKASGMKLNSTNGTHAVIEHVIVDLIHIEKIECPCPVRSNSHLVVKQAVAPNRFHSHVATCAHQVFAPLLPKSNNSAV